MVSATSGDLILRSSSVRKATCQGQLAVFSVIQMQPSRHFHLAVDSLDLRRGASWSQIIDQAQDLPTPRMRIRTSKDSIVRYAKTRSTTSSS
jgi:hypothetical protein